MSLSLLVDSIFSSFYFVLFLFISFYFFRQIVFRSKIDEKHGKNDPVVQNSLRWGYFLPIRLVAYQQALCLTFKILGTDAPEAAA